LSGLIIDNFAGGGGASTGIEAALGRNIDYAINHDPQAVAMHKANHPKTYHFCEDVWEVEPRTVTKGREVALAWFSPDCKHFSRAKGGTPVEKNIRGLAWVATRYAKEVRPKVIMLENVQEFVEWGPLDKDGRPNPDLRGKTFTKWVNQFKRLGYRVDWKNLMACDYGAPTSRKRLFMVARLDGEPIVWPTRTHGFQKLPHRSAAECIDWSIPCPSIFTRKKPLAENTLRRIAMGIKKFVIDAQEPFIVTCNHGGKGFRGQALTEPMKTITAAYDAHGLVVPYITRICQTGFGGDNLSYPMDKPLTTIVSKNEHLLCAAWIAKHYTGATGSKVSDPLPTTTARGTQNQLAFAFLTRHFGNSIGADVKKPAPTITPGGQGKSGLVTSHLIKFRGTTSMGYGQDLRDPLHTISASGTHFGEVRAFLIKYYGTAIAQAIDQPLHSITSKARFGLVCIAGEDYQIVDIGMRMLTPRELFLAQGFPEEYVIDPEYNGKPLTKTAQVRMVGNSVSPHPAEALVRANVSA